MIVLNFDCMRFQYYSNDATKPNPLGYVSIDKFLDSIKNPSDKVKDLLSKIEKASNDGNKKLKANLKKNLYGFTPSATFKNRRAYSDIINFTGIAVLDFDKVDYVKEFKEHIFNTYSSIFATWISPSKKGIKAFVKIPIVNKIEQFKEYFYGIASEMQMYKGFDYTTQNASLLLFIGHDPDILIKDDYTEWNIKGEKVNEFSKSRPIIKPNYEPTTKQRDWVINWYTDKINSISDNGHPQVRDNSVSLGGYVGSNYITYYEAVSLAEYLISTNGYLQKGTEGYIKTAKQSINLGITKPLTFDG